MPHWTSGKRLVTAAANRCAVLWRYSASASGFFSVTILTEASRLSGNVRSTSLPSTRPASAALARRGDIDSATSRTSVPAGTWRGDPSGNVTVTWFIDDRACGGCLAGPSNCLVRHDPVLSGVPAFRLAPLASFGFAQEALSNVEGLKAIRHVPWLAMSE